MIGEGLLGRRGTLSGRRPLAGRLPRPRPRFFVVLAVVAVVLVGGWLWFRDSSLVSVKRVRVSGLNDGPDAAQIRRALVAAAHNMTTLDVHLDRLRTAVAAYPVVKDLRVSTQFPHGMRITVVEQVAVAAVTAGGHQTAVAADGTLLQHVSPAMMATLPVVPVNALPGGTHLTEPDAVSAVQLLAAAPYAMLAKVAQVSTEPHHGLVAQLRNGPALYFGDPSRLAAKWAAVLAVLGDPGSVGASYIDVTDPDRPAAGAGTASASGTSDTGSVSSGGASSTGTAAAATTASSSAAPGG